MVLAKFRQRYPQGSLVSELIDIDRGTYIVGVSVIVNNITLSTGLAGADTVETAEDLARERAIVALMLDSYSPSDRDNLDSKTKVQDNAVTRLSQEVPAVKAAPSFEQKLAPEDRTSIEDDEIVFAENLASQTTQSDPNILNSAEDATLSTSLSFEPEVREQISNSDSTVEKATATPLPEQSVSNSANLFAGTSNSETYNTLKDNRTSVEASATEATEAETSQADIIEEVNFNEIKHQTDLEIKRLGWTKDDGREFLKSRYGKRSRLQLTDNQLLEFLQYLASQPSPT